MSEIKAFFIRLVILLIFLWLLFGVFFGITPMRGNDMFPRISAGDLLLYYRLEKNFNSGDVLVFRKQGKISTGRVVAHGGDSVEITGDGELKVNGSIVIETNVFYKTYPYDKKKVNYPLSLKKDEVFLLCDYREGGRDSRYFGAVSKKEIKDDINIELFVDLFQNIYLGTSFAGVVHEDGYKIDQLKREFMQIYQLIKK